MGPTYQFLVEPGPSTGIGGEEERDELAADAEPDED
jgi:hypothetical protein